MNTLLAETSGTEISPLRRGTSSSLRWLERLLIPATLALGAFNGWEGRYAMDPDGISYLDVGHAFFRHDWASAVNAWWSPLYSWSLGIFMGITNPPARYEFPVAQIFNFAIFVVALLAFRFFLHELIGFCEEPPDGFRARGRSLPAWAIVLLGYPLFLWVALEVDPLWCVTPDLAVVACVCLTAAMLLRVRRNPRLGEFMVLGLVLGIGYWTKAILFPVGFVALAAAYWWRRRTPRWGQRILLALVVFLAVAGPLIFLLSRQKGRLTFSDTGRLNYAWYVSPRTFWRNWQGDEAGSGVPVHPTRRVMKHPPLFEFDGPIDGTYPPWTDPSYWNEGVQWHFKVKPQLEVLAGTVSSEIRLLTRSRPDVLVAVIVLALLAGSMWLAGLRELWPLIAMCLVGMGLYLPMVENDRYLGGFILVLFLVLLAAARFRPENQKAAGYVAMAVFCTMMLASLDYNLRLATHHFAILGNGPNSTLADLAAAEQLQQMGLRPGDKVGIIMNGTNAYWAHLAKLRIVAEIMDGPEQHEFWDAPTAVQNEVFDRFAGAHAKAVVTRCASAVNMPGEWERVEDSQYCVHRLD